MISVSLSGKCADISDTLRSSPYFIANHLWRYRGNDTAATLRIRLISLGKGKACESAVVLHVLVTLVAPGENRRIVRPAPQQLGIRRIFTHVHHV